MGEESVGREVTEVKFYENFAGGIFKGPSAESAALSNNIVEISFILDLINFEAILCLFSVSLG